MPHDIVWLVEKRVLLTTFHGTISTQELTEFIDEVRTHARSGIPLVHLITNSLDLQKVEFTLTTLKSLAEAAKMMGELGWQLDINRNPINRMFAGLAAQFARVRSRTFLSLDDAVNFLKTTDPGLANLEWHFDAEPIPKV